MIKDESLEKKIIDFYVKENLSIQQIKEKTGKGYKYIRRILKENNVEVKIGLRQIKLKENEIRLLEKLAKQGKSIKEIAQEVGYDIKVIKRTAKENNISTTEEQEINKTVTETTTTAENVGALFSSLKDAEETFSTYSIYIVREEETVQSIIEKYKTTKEELEKYNDLSSLKIGTKLIIPTTNENWSKTIWRTKT